MRIVWLKRRGSVSLESVAAAGKEDEDDVIKFTEIIKNDTTRRND